MPVITEAVLLCPCALLRPTAPGTESLPVSPVKAGAHDSVWRHSVQFPPVVAPRCGDGSVHRNGFPFASFSVLHMYFFREAGAILQCGSRSDRSRLHRKHRHFPRRSGRYHLPASWCLRLIDLQVLACFKGTATLVFRSPIYQWSSTCELLHRHVSLRAAESSESFQLLYSYIFIKYLAVFPG